MTEAKPMVVIAAGGTGGHMFPAQAFAEEMRARGWAVALVTDERGEKYAKDFPADFRKEVEAATFGSRSPAKMLGSILRLRAGAEDAKAMFRDHKPKLVAGFGGYPSYPSLSAARALQIPILIHEQNAVLGRVNRLFAKSARFVACGFDRLDRLPPAALSRKRVVGNPVRTVIRQVRDIPYPELSPSSPVRILVTGGSQGARLFGEVIPKAIAGLPEQQRANLSVMQQVREEQIEEVRGIYAAANVRADLAPFFSDMRERLAAAHLVIARAGASTVTELAMAGRPSILIPLAIAMDDHQTANAEHMVGAGAADILDESRFTSDALRSLLSERLGNLPMLVARAKAAHALGQRDAARDLADLAEEAAGVRAATAG